MSEARLLPGVGPTWVEINLDNLAHNVREVRKMIGPRVRLLAVVKADAYGHGAVEVARVALAHGADRLGVFSLAEARELRAAGIKAPTMVFASPLLEQVDEAVALDVAVSVAGDDVARALGAAGRRAGRTVPVHLEVDTGMRRGGVPPAAAPDMCARLAEIEGITLEGIYTHFAHPDARRNRRQLEQFEPVLAELTRRGLRPPIAHAANSAGVVGLPESYLDMVRVGNLLYGVGAHGSGLDVRLTWSLKARVVQVRRVARGEGVGYGSDFIANRDMTVGVLAVGLADGFMLDPVRPVARPLDWLSRVVTAGLQGWRAMSRGNGVRLGGRPARLVGRVGMQHCLVDISGMDVQEGDVATVQCRWTAVSSRVPRVYIETGRPIKVALPAERRIVAFGTPSA